MGFLERIVLLGCRRWLTVNILDQEYSFSLARLVDYPLYANTGVLQHLTSELALPCTQQVVFCSRSPRYYSTPCISYWIVSLEVKAGVVIFLSEKYQVKSGVWVYTAGVVFQGVSERGRYIVATLPRNHPLGQSFQLCSHFSEFDLVFGFR